MKQNDAIWDLPIGSVAAGIMVSTIVDNILVSFNPLKDRRLRWLDKLMIHCPVKRIRARWLDWAYSRRKVPMWVVKTALASILRKEGKELFGVEATNTAILFLAQDAVQELIRMAPKKESKRGGNHGNQAG